MDDIDVFIPVYNDIKFLPKAVESALSQEGVKVRIVISDNASTDGTYEWAIEASHQHPNIVVFRNPENRGAVANLNRFRDLVSAPFFTLLCSDDILAKVDALKKALALIRTDPNAVSVYCDLSFIDGRGDTMASKRFHRRGKFSSQDALRKSIIECRNLFGIPLLHRSRFVLTSSYPSELTYTADLYLSAAISQGRTVYHIDEILVGNRYSGANSTVSVINRSQPQFDLIASYFGIALSPSEKVRQYVNFYKNLILKKMFLFWSVLRSK